MPHLFTKKIICSSCTWFVLISAVWIGCIQKSQMTAADKALHGIVVSDMLNNDQIQVVSYSLSDYQHSPNEVCEFQEIWALVLVPPLHYCTNCCLGSALLSCGRDRRSFTIIISNFLAENRTLSQSSQWKLHL